MFHKKTTLQKEVVPETGRGRQKRKLWLGLRAQMLSGLLIIFSLSAVLISWMAGRQLEANREAQIASELSVIRENTEVYVKQLLILNEANNDEASFLRLAEDMAGELGETGMGTVAVCSREGKLLAGALEETGPEPSEAGSHVEEDRGRDGDPDLTEAVDGNAAFTLLYGKDGRLAVRFSMPVSVEGKTIGIVRCVSDYSGLWQRGRRTEQIVLRAVILVFGAEFLLIALFLNRILKPVGKLARVSRQMTFDLEQGQINTRLLAGLADSGRKDEIGELSRDYSVMLKRTGRYISRMQEDRDRIRALMESRQEFYNNVTHELKTPLTTIQGYAQLLEADGGRDRELFEKGLAHILQESTRLHRMVVELLEMGDKSSGEETGPVDMNRLIQSVAEAMEIRANRYGCHLNVRLEDGLVVYGASGRLRQIFINLIDNAVKYGETGEEIHINGRHRAGGILFCVENRAVQRPGREELERIFEPFYRLDKEYARDQGSAGLGLSICRKITEEYGGRIWAENTVGGRVRFSVFFPEEAAG